MMLPVPLAPAKADRFRHDGDQLIPGSGRRWSHVHRTKDAQPNAKAGAASQGERFLQSCQQNLVDGDSGDSGDSSLILNSGWWRNSIGVQSFPFLPFFWAVEAEGRVG